MNTRAKSIKIIFDNSSEDNWEATCEGGIEFDDAMRMIARAWKERGEPTEPLIKDEKIRKAVRAWADGNDVINVQFDAFWRGLRHNNSTITVWEDLPFEDGKIYSIDELCGPSDSEEEE